MLLFHETIDFLQLNACYFRLIVNFAFKSREHSYMTIVIVSILLLGCLLIATENITKVNRAAVAILLVRWDGFCIFVLVWIS